MRTSISKKLLAGALSVMMVLSLVAPTGAQAASKYSVTGYKTVKAGKTYTYKIKGVKKSQYVKVQRNVSGETVKYNKKALTAKKQVKGTGKNLTLKVKFSEKNKNYTGKFTVRIYNAKSNKLVKKIVKSVNVKTQVEEKKAVESVTLSSTTPKVGDTLTATATPADAEIASYVWYADGVAIEGATTATYVVASTDLTKKISVAVTDSLGNTVTSEQTAAVVEADKKELELTAKQTGAATIEVTANQKLVNEDVITVTRGTTEQTITKAFSEDGKTVTLTLATAITASDYVIKVVPKDTAVKEATVTVKGEKAVLSKIKFESDKLVLIDNAGKNASVVVTGNDQFGAKVAISKSNTTFYAAGATMVDYTSDTGVLELTPTGVYPFTVGQSIQVTAVYNDGTTILQESVSLTISAAAYVKTLEFGELATTNADLKGKRVTIDNFNDDSYYYPIVAKDQYERALSATELNKMKDTAHTLLVSPTVSGYAYIDTFDTLKDGTVIAKVKKGSTALIPTTVPLTITSVGGGAFTANLKIEDNPYIATLDVSIPEAYNNNKVEVTVSAKDQNGEAYDFYSDGTRVLGGDIVFGDVNALATAKSTIEASIGSFTMVKETKTKTVKFYYTCENAGKAAITDTVTVKTATPTVTILRVTVNPSGTAEKVQGIASGVATTLKNGDHAIELGEAFKKNIVFLDNYGAVMTAGLPTFENNTGNMSGETTYYYSVTQGTTPVVNGTIAWHNDTDKDINVTYTITLYKGGATPEKKNSVDFVVKFVKRSTTYACGLTNDDMMYVAANSTDDDVVWVRPYEDGVAQSYLTSGDFTLTDDLGLVEGNAVDASKIGNLPANTTGKDVIYVTVHGEVVGNIVLEYSNVEPEAKEVYFAKVVNENPTGVADKVTVSAAKYTFNNGVFSFTDGAAKYVLGISDQYGQDVTTGVTVKLNGNKLTESADAASSYLLFNGSENTVSITKGTVTKTVSIINNSDGKGAVPAPTALAATMIGLSGTGDEDALSGTLSGAATATLSTEEITQASTIVFAANSGETFTAAKTAGDEKYVFNAETKTLTIPSDAVNGDEIKITFTGTSSYTGTVVLTITIVNAA
jgi:hypothetical protein